MKKLLQSFAESNIESRYTDAYIELTKKRIIFLAEDVTLQTASDLSSLLLYYDVQDPEKEITLYINSYGGDIYALINIYDTMRLIKAPIKTVALGRCYSAGAVILAAGTKGKRYALKNSSIMIHGMQCTFPIPGHDAINSQNYFEFLEKNNDNILKILATHTNKTLQSIKKDCEKDIWLDSQEAINYGIIDKIL